MYQEIIDGLPVDKNQARFTGTFDLDQADLEALAMDRVAFLVVAVRIEQMNAKITPEADVKRLNVLRVQDARVARDELRADAVQWLAGKNGQGVLDFKEQMGLASEAELQEEAEFMQSRVVNSETGEVQTGVQVEEFEDPTWRGAETVSVPTDVEVVAGPYRGSGNRGGGNGSASLSTPKDRPGVAKFDPAAFGDSVPAGVRPGVREVEQVGSVYPRDRKDSRLAEFMETGE